MTVFDEMVAGYDGRDQTATPNIEQEVMQQIALAGLHRGGFFQHAAFYGGTCLRLFHHLPRFSEDMDFSLVKGDGDIHIEQFFPAIIEEFQLAGHPIEIVKKDKKSFGRVESAFLKDDTEAYDIRFQTKKTIKVKIELDTDPPLLFDTEQQLLLQPYSLMVRCFTLPDLYAGKMHALVYRTWKHRVKGRDWYDFEWYVRHQVPLHFRHLQERIRKFNGQDIGLEEFKQTLREKLATTNIELVKQDIQPYITHPQELEIWSNDYFLQLAERIVFQ
ncbi:MAG: nucleotidyl transferase AbiEii/AbiGii toxin family protein [Prevotella sp.]|nr:nucleotidyl transferase AbiEii/AbiGii toxin family protein [Prevotella sp.]